MNKQTAIDLLAIKLNLENETYQCHLEHGGNKDDFIEGVIEAISEAIESLKQPEIIYCKDCMYGYPRTNIPKNEYEYGCAAWDMSVPQFGYCGEAKRIKEND